MVPSTAPAFDPLPRRLIALPGVYRPQADTWLLAEALSHEPMGADSDILDIGTGTGALALSAARTGARVEAVDVSWPAVITAGLNAFRQRLPLRVMHGDFETRAQGRCFDVVLTNPPYVPSARARPPSHGAARAWDAGPDGRVVIDRVCACAPALLRPGGVLLMVHSGMCGPPATLARLEAGGLSAGVTARTSVPWGPVLRARRTWLRRQGLACDGNEREELVIIRAEHP
ncbi:HemK2/MTQ2 family protein methyltransferase [Streptomyces sp. NBC_00572]|uniref:HemK2/MTQ2 family protein methyltransferase n=1 Tax=Streptomyces sp. NBC_00572 TaxID=2903664 RepID=UPI0022584E11|nr:HemK2/MTQ2 family protein methyltransferase [Streptomyces sp. NBC_00572]MCX4986654.1 methyltransferase [Streptomyces sp. NBC_00572]